MIFTNYQFYVDAFVQSEPATPRGRREGLEAFVAPGNVITRNARLGGGTTGAASPSGPRRCRAFHLVESGYLAASP